MNISFKYGLSLFLFLNLYCSVKAADRAGSATVSGVNVCEKTAGAKHAVGSSMQLQLGKQSPRRSSLLKRPPSKASVVPSPNQSSLSLAGASPGKMIGEIVSSRSTDAISSLAAASSAAATAAIPVRPSVTVVINPSGAASPVINPVDSPPSIQGPFPSVPVANDPSNKISDGKRRIAGRRYSMPDVAALSAAASAESQSDSSSPSAASVVVTHIPLKVQSVSAGASALGSAHLSGAFSSAASLAALHAAASASSATSSSSCAPVRVFSFRPNGVRPATPHAAVPLAKDTVFSLITMRPRNPIPVQGAPASGCGTTTPPSTHSSPGLVSPLVLSPVKAPQQASLSQSGFKQRDALAKVTSAGTSGSAGSTPAGSVPGTKPPSPVRHKATATIAGIPLSESTGDYVISLNAASSSVASSSSTVGSISSSSSAQFESHTFDPVGGTSSSDTLF